MHLRKIKSGPTVVTSMLFRADMLDEIREWYFDHCNAIKIINTLKPIINGAGPASGELKIFGQKRPPPLRGVTKIPPTRLEGGKKGG